MISVLTILCSTKGSAENAKRQNTKASQFVHSFSWIYLENNLKHISPNSCSFASRLFVMGTWSFCCIRHVKIFSMHRNHEVGALLCIYTHIINTFTTNFVVILVASIHGKHRSKLQIVKFIIRSWRKKSTTRRTIFTRRCRYSNRLIEICIWR